MCSLFFVINLGFFVSIARPETTEEEYVLVSTTDNFQEAIDDPKFIMIEFYTRSLFTLKPWLQNELKLLAW